MLGGVISGQSTFQLPSESYLKMRLSVFPVMANPFLGSKYFLPRRVLSICWKLIQLYRYILSTDYIQSRALDVALETKAHV